MGMSVKFKIAPSKTVSYQEYGRYRRFSRLQFLARTFMEKPQFSISKEKTMQSSFILIIQSS